jgi:cytochrome c oxidase cbb3-type subunit III
MRRIASVSLWTAIALGIGGAPIVLAQDRAAARTEPRPFDSPREGERLAQGRPTKNPYEGKSEAISNGGAMFRTRCAGCHGPDAHGYLGPDLTGFWAAGGTDDRMFDIVRKGVPGTEMIAADPMRVLDRDIWQVMAYIRTLNAVPLTAPTGDAANGAQIFRANCSSCHTVNARGGELGPDLSRIGSARPRAGLQGKLRGTTTFIRPGYEPVTLVTRSGERIRGVKKNEDEFSIQIMDMRERLQGYLKDNLAEYRVEKQSVMPVYGPDRLNDRDLNDLLQYLAGLRGTQAASR